jgi:integrase
MMHLVQDRALSARTATLYKNALAYPLQIAFGIDPGAPEWSLASRALFHRNPPSKPSFPSWNLEKVLTFLSTARFANASASEYDLLMKALFLVALASGNRASELAALDRTKINFTPDGAVHIPVRKGFLYKNQSVTRAPPNISFPALQEEGTGHVLCPVQALKAYLAKTADEPTAVFRNSRTRKPLSSATIASTLCTVIDLAHPGQLPKGHDVRKQAASLAWTRGMPPAEIICKAFWATSSVFVSRYLHPVAPTPCVALTATH